MAHDQAMRQRPAPAPEIARAVPPPRQLSQLAQDLNAAPPVQHLVQLSAAANATGMPDALKQGMEAVSGLDLSGVRVHANSDRPAQFAASAFAQGDQVYLGPGQDQHLPHEIGHVVQQMQGRVPVTGAVNGAPLNDDPALEAEADRISAAAMQRLTTIADL